MTKRKRRIISAALAGCMVLSGCGSESVQVPSVTTKTTTTERTTTAAVWDEWEPDEWDIESEPEREIKTSAETKEEVIALFLKAFYEKDTEVLSAFRRSNYDAMFNDLCKALDDEGNLPEDINEIDLDPKLFEVYNVYNSFVDTWEATYPLANGNFTFYIDFGDYDYVTKTYSIKSIKLKDHLDLSFLGLSGYRDAAASGEPAPGGCIIEVKDITPYLD